MPGTSGRPECLGDYAHDAAETTTSFPVKIGGVAYNFDGTALPAAVAELDRTEFRATPDGRQLVELGHPHFFHTIAAYTAAQTKQALVAAPAAGLSLYLTDVHFVGESNAAVGNIDLLDDLTTTGLKIRARMGVNSNFEKSYRQPVKLTAAKALGVTTEMTTSSVFVSGYTAP